MAALRAYLKRNGLLILASLLLAVLVWKYVNDELTETRVVDARLVLDVPPGLTLAAPVQPTVRAVLRATSRNLARLEQVTAHYKLPNRAGPIEVALRSGDFALPAGVEMSELPDRFFVDLEHLERKTVLVRVVTTGQPATGYVVSGVPGAEPAEVDISGRKETIESVKEVRTQAVDLGGKNKPFTKDVQLVAPPEVRCRSELVLVFVDIGVEPVIREVVGVDVKVLVPSGFDTRVRAEPALIAVKLRGDPAVLTGLASNPREILAVADLSGLVKPLKPEGQEVPVRLVLPPGVSLAPGAAAPKVRVHLSEK